MNSIKCTNAYIHAKLAYAADAISRSRDDLKDREKSTIVSIYSMRQMRIAITKILEAYNVALENTLPGEADLQELLRECQAMDAELVNAECFPDAVLRAERERAQRDSELG